jgi:predicted DNA-binding WGR domain protein
VDGERSAPVWIALRWERGTRYYEARLHPNLWGQWVVTRSWGRRGQRLGRVVDVPCASYEEGRQHLAAVQARRQQRGYVVVASPCQPTV